MQEEEKKPNPAPIGRRAVFNGGLNISKLSEDAAKDAQFRKIVNQAMEHSGVRDMDDKALFMNWALGDDYKMLPYQDWPARISERTRLIGMTMHTSVYQVIRAAAELWKQKRIMVGMN